MDRSDNTSPGAEDRPQDLKLDKIFRFGSDSTINRKT